MKSGYWRHVAQGESIESIATEMGRWPEAIWTAPENDPLHKNRTPNILFERDVVFIPHPDMKSVSCPTDQVHPFVLRRFMSRLRVLFLDDDHPRANAAYTITIDEVERPGRTDGEGFLDEIVSPTAMQAVVHFAADKENVYTLQLRHLDPVTELSGVQMRLRNLGYTPGRTDGVPSPETEAAISAFQRASNIKQTGIQNSSTADLLKSAHGC